MKKILLLLGVALSSMTVNSQTTCANATTITANGTITTPAFGALSVFNNACGLATKTGNKAIWYKYTPAANGEISISSDIATNVGPTYTDDTRVSIFTGTCTPSALVCNDFNDDIADDNYLSSITVPVAAGTTYYIQWDNYWQQNQSGAITGTLPFKFTFNFTATPCVRIGANDFYLPEDYTTTSATLYFDKSLSNPANYEADWSVTMDAAPGTGTIVSAAANTDPLITYASVGISDLPPSSNFRYYIRANCGATQSAWQGPEFGYLAAPATQYSNNFDDAAKNFTDGFVGQFAMFNSTATSNPANYDGNGGVGRSMYTFNSTTAASNLRAYTRGFNLTAGETVTITFKTRLFVTSGNPSAMTLDLTAGQGQSAADQTTIVQTFSLTSNASYTTHTATFTPTVAGTYFFGFHNKSAQGANQTFAFLDNIGTTSVLSVDEMETAEFSVSPNPSSNVINVTNTKNVLVNGITVTDLNGRVVKKLSYNNVAEASVNVADLATGVYMMDIASDKGNIIKKIVKK